MKENSLTCPYHPDEFLYDGVSTIISCLKCRKIVPEYSRNIQAKTPVEIMEEFDRLLRDNRKVYPNALTSNEPWLRASMQSLLEHVVSEMPEKKIHNSVDTSPMEIQESISYNNARSDCIAAIRKIQESI